MELEKTHVQFHGTADNTEDVVELSSKYDRLFKEIVPAGWCDESSGNVEAPSGYFSIISYTPLDRASFVDMLDDTDLIDLFDELESGFFLTQENSDGLIWVYHGPESAIRSIYAMLGEVYCAWEDDNISHHGSAQPL